MSLLDYCEKVEELITKLDLNKITVVAHSFGGRVAMLLATRCEKIAALVLVDSAGLKPKKTIKYYQRKLDYKFKKAFHMDLSNCGSDDYKKLSPIMKQTFSNIVNTHLDYLLPKIRVATLIINGSKDKETPPYMAKRLNKGIANSGLVFLDGGHFCYIDKLYDFTKILASFLGDIYDLDTNSSTHI